MPIYALETSDYIMIGLWYEHETIGLYHMEVITMAIEPLGSVMSFQAQTVQPTTQKVPVEKPAAEFTEGSALNNAMVVDNKTPVVSQTTETSEQNNNSQQKMQQTNEQIRKTVEELNKKMMNSEAVFGIHDETNRVTIKIVDKETKEVIRELPPEKTLDMIAKAWELAGILVDERR